MHACLSIWQVRHGNHRKNANSLLEGSPDVERFAIAMRDFPGNRD
jgi:hypothetical protein